MLRQVAGMAVSDARHVAPQLVAVALVPAKRQCTLAYGANDNATERRAGHWLVGTSMIQKVLAGMNAHKTGRRRNAQEPGSRPTPTQLLEQNHDGCPAAPVRQVSRPSRVVALVAAVLVHGNRVLYFFSAAARRRAAITPALHLVEMADSCCGGRGTASSAHELLFPRLLESHGPGALWMHGQKSKLSQGLGCRGSSPSGCMRLQPCP